MAIISVKPAQSVGNVAEEPVARNIPAHTSEQPMEITPAAEAGGAAGGTEKIDVAEKPLSESARYVQGLGGVGRIRRQQIQLQQQQEQLRQKEVSLSKLSKADEALKAGKIDEALAAMGLPYDELVKKKLGAAGTPADQIAALQEELQDVRTGIETKEKAAQTAAQQAEQQAQIQEVHEFTQEIVTDLHKSVDKYPHLVAFGAGPVVVQELAKMVRADPSFDPTPENIAIIASRVEKQMSAVLPVRVKELLAIPSVRAAVVAELGGKQVAPAAKSGAQTPKRGMPTVTNGLTEGGGSKLEPTFKDIVKRVEQRLANQGS